MVRGDATAEEIAALVTALIAVAAARSAAAAPAERAARSRNWNARARLLRSARAPVRRRLAPLGASLTIGASLTRTCRFLSVCRSARRDVAHIGHAELLTPAPKASLEYPSGSRPGRHGASRSRASPP